MELACGKLGLGGQWVCVQLGLHMELACEQLGHGKELVYGKLGLGGKLGLVYGILGLGGMELGDHIQEHGGLVHEQQQKRRRLHVVYG